MRFRRPVPDTVARLSDRQSGVVTREQARGLGLTDHVLHRLVAEGRWRRLAAGVYRTADVEPTWEALAWAGVLIGGDDARLGPRSSGHLHALLSEPPLPVDVLVPPNGSRLRPGPWHFVQEQVGVRSTRSVGSPPRLTVEDTILDLCGAGTESEVVGLVTTAVQQRLTRPRRLQMALDGRRRFPHRALLTALVVDVAEGAESSLELGYLRDVERAHGLPPGRRQRSRAGLPYVTDVGYEEYALLVELDGRLGHVGMGRFRDMDRDNRFALARLTSLRYGWIDVVDHPCRVAFQVGSVLHTQGWPGPLSRCPRCAAALDIDLLLSV